MRNRFGLLVAWVMFACSACLEAETRAPERQPEVAATVAPLWSNGDFDNDSIGATPPSGWAVTTYLNANGVLGSSSSPPSSFAALNLSAGGKLETYVIGGPVESQTDPDLGAGQGFRFPKYGTRAARVNYKSASESGKDKNANALRQTMTIELGDIDPNDGQIHVRFVVAPVLENPSHGYIEQPYYFVQLQNLTRNTTLYKDFNIAGQAGVPWKTTISAVTGNTTQWLNWQLIDLAPGAAAISVGDSVQLAVIAAGCKLGGHFGRVYVDGVGPSIPGLFTWATAPSSVNTNTNLTYTIYYSNGGSSSALGAHVDMVTPPQTTYVSTTGSNCTAPAAGATGTISCPLGALAAGSSGSFQVTVNVNSGATGSVTNGNYSIGAVNSSDLLGAKVTTSVIGSTTTTYAADVKVTQTASFTTKNWGQAVTLTIKVKNLGTNDLNKNKSNQLTVTDIFPSQLTGVTWTCAVTNGATNGNSPTSCIGGNGNTGPSASGSGNISTRPKLSGVNQGEVTYTVTGNVVGGSGTGAFTNTPTATVSVRTDPDLTNNSAPLTIPLGTPRTLTLTKTGSISSGSVTSSPAALSCGTACTSPAIAPTFIDGSTVILTATPIPGATFSSWGGACSGSSRTCTLTMNADKSVTASFVAPPAVGAAANVYVYRGDNQSARTNNAFALPLSALVTDANGTAKSGVTVTFTAVPNNGASATLSSVTTTNAAGIATAVATANASAGSYTVTAAVSGVSTPATFSLLNVGPPSSITYISGGNVTDPNRAPGGVAFPAPLMVLVKDSSGNAVPGASVSYTVTPAGMVTATLSSASATTDSSGFASVTATAGSTAGSFQASATTNALTPVTFELQNVASTPASVFVISGSPQHAVPADPFDPLVVGVADVTGNALNNIAITFAAPASGATAALSATSANSDSLGTASITATAGNTVGSYSVTATVANVAPTSFTLANDGTQAIDVQSGNPQSATVGQAFQSLVAIVTNSSTGDPVSGATVTFTTVPVGGATATLGVGAVSMLDATTNASGVATVTATAGTVAGSYTVKASTTQTGAPAIFNLTNVAGSAASIAATNGAGQQATISNGFTNPLIATVSDSNGNRVSGAIVTFTAPANGASATIVGSPATTDSSGQVSVTVTANATVGAYNVSAAASGAGSVNFGLTNSAAPGCTQDSDCNVVSEYCNTQTTTCTAKLANGVAMPTVTGHTPVLNGTCTTNAAAVVCTSGVCSNDNKCGYTTSVGPCDGSTAATVCRSGACSVSGVCMPSGGCAVGGDCNIANAGATCNAGTCELASCNAGYGNCDSSAANGCERALGDVQNCGGCDQVCSLAHATQACTSGSCAVGACDSGYADCNGTASDGCELFIGGSDRNHCGGCSTVCSGSQYCSSGSCVATLANNTSCSAADQCTSGVCSADSLCGVANNGACSGASVCRGGACSASGACMNSGSCLVDGDCASNKFCDTAQSQCVGKLSNGTPIPMIANHTPALTGACSTAVGNAVCSAGVCDSDDACGYINDTGSCSSGNASTVCRSSVCGSDSKCGYPDLEGTCNSGNAATICRSGSCTSSSNVCAAAGGCSEDADCTSQQFCDTAANSCVAKLTNGQALPIIANHSPLLDGSCSMAVGSAVCAAGVCDSGDSRCGLRNGQGTCTTNDAATVCRSGVCGSDGKCGYLEGEGSCSSVNAGTVCRSTQCSMSSLVCVAANGCQVDGDCDSVHYCDTAQQLCVPKLSNGVALPTTANHTPVLDGTCSGPVGAAVCAAGVCDGTDNRCGLRSGQGTCSNANAGTVCRNGVCGSDNKCGYLDAEGSCSDVTAGNVCRSGACSVSGACRPTAGCVVPGDCSFDHGVAACSNGSCNLASCDAGYANCNNVASDGCERDLQSDASHCNACAAACSQNNGALVCSAGSCTVVSCDAGYGDCNLDAADGCEKALLTSDAANCGACGYTCSNGQFCSAGVCTAKRNNNVGCTTDSQCSSGVCTLADLLCGLVDDEPCTSDDECRGGVCSQLGVCMASDSCRVDADCASDSFCNTASQQCSPKLTNGASVPTVTGHDPDLDGECTPSVGSAVCSAGVCDASDDRCGYTNGTGACTPNDASIVCRSGVCGGDSKCGYRDGEGTCLDSNAALVCRSGTCASSNVCIAASQCLTDDDCEATHYCDTAASACTIKLGNAIAIPTVQGHDPELNGTCTVDAGAVVCSSAVCDSTDNKCGYSNGNGQCDLSSAGRVCRGGVCGGDGACGYGEGEGPCTSVDASDRCRSKLCSAASHVCVEANGCRVDGDCLSNQFCDTVANSCTPKLALGVSVPTIANHTPALNGTCTDAVGLAVCSSGVCDSDGRCGYANRNGSCNTNTAAQVCRSGVCGSDNACGYLDGEGSCTTNNAADVCRSQLCSTASQICVAADGCSVDGDCSNSQFCDSSQARCVPKLDNGTAIPTIPQHAPALTGACSGAVGLAVCSSGVCDSSDGRCGYPNGSGSCTNNTATQVCRSGVCGSDQACGYPDGEGSCDDNDAASVCRSQLCSSVSQVCAAPAGCSVDGDCSGTQFCDSVRSRCVPKLDNGVQIPTLALHTPALTGMCTEEVGQVVCSSGVCDSDGRCGYSNRSGPCTANNAGQLCRSAVCGGDNACGYPDGEGGCTAGNAGNVCRSQLCSSVSMVCVAAGGCSVDDDCSGTQFCDTASSSCVPKLDNGAQIPTIAQHTPPLTGMCSDAVALVVCSSGVCDSDGRCGRANSSGPCTSNNAAQVCRSGVCDGSDGRCGYANMSGPCTSNNASQVCRSSVCGGDNACGYQDGEGSCDADSASDVCRSQLCSAISLLCIAADGCSVDGDCPSSQFCDSARSLCTPKLDNGVQIPTIAQHAPPLTGACSEQVGLAVCSSGVCDSDGRCGYVNSHGSCSLAEQCRSGVCTNADQLCGSIDDESCTSADECRGGACSQAGVCMASDSCRIDADCASDSFCDTGERLCTPKLANSVSIPSVAGHDPELAGLCTPDVGSAVCSAAVCDTSDEKCGYANGSGPCTGNTASSVCRSGICGSDNKCGYRDGEGACTDSDAASVCRSGTCASSLVCVAAGQCLSDSDCEATHYCDTGESVCTPKLGNAIAIPVVQGHDPELRGACTLDAGAAVCSSAVCDVDDDKCGYLNGSGQCDGSNAETVCRSGVCGGDGACGYREGEGPCTSVDASDRCRSQVCSSASHVCVAPNGCRVDDDCPSTHFCDTGANSCTPKLGQGIVIPVIAGHTPALSGTCNDAVGLAVCSSGVCDSSDGRCGYANLTGPCSTSNAAQVCRSAACGSDNACGYVDGEGSCTASTAGDVCRSQLCSSASELCIAAAGCSVDDDCPDTQFCDSVRSRCTPKLDNGVLIPSIAGHEPALTGLCDTAVGFAVCSSGVCDSSDGRCGYLNTHGPCDGENAAALCRSGVCGGDGQCGYLDTEGSCSSADAGNLCRSQQCAVSGVCRPVNGCVTSADCQAAHAVATCSDSVCGWSQCEAGYADCNVLAADGCEIQTGGSDPANCGGCGRVCALAYASALCSSGMCAIESCETGRADCDSSAASGCETAVAAEDPANCGACGTRCADSEFCSAGSCSSKRANGQACGAAVQCKSGVCAQDGLCGLRDGAACSGATASTCRGNACSVAGECMSTSACRADGDCTLTQFCDTVASKCQDKLSNGTPIPSLNGHKPPLTGMCTNDVGTAVCASAVCEVADELCGRVNGSPCSDAAQCRSDVCGADGQCGVKDGDGPCTVETGARVCRSAVCADGSVCGPTVGCGMDSDCAETQFCNTGDATCAAKLGNGTTLPILPRHEPKATGVCTAAIGGALCAAGVCDNDDACGYGNGRGSCDEDSAARVCRSGVCGSDGKCGYLDDEGSCSSSDASTVCRSALCGDEQRCQAPPRCSTDSDCDEDRFCDTTLGSCSVKLAAGYAIPSIPGHVPPLEGVCSEEIASLVCSAGVCSDSDNACAFPNELGACDDSNAGAMCRSGVCGGDLSCGWLEGEGSCTSLNGAQLCRSGVCGADGQCGPPPPCDVDADCEDTQFCNTDLRYCRSKLRNGTKVPILPAHEPALTGECTETAAQSVCMSGVCDDSDDACGYANGVGSCDETSAPDVCRSRTCGSDQRCGYAAGEGPCDAVSASSVCRSGTCGGDGLCRAPGCVSDAGCEQDQYCELASGRCKVRRVEGGGCASDSECVSGSCDLASGTCNSCVGSVCGHASLRGGGCSIALGPRAPGVIALCLFLAPLGVWCRRRWQRRGSRS